MKSRQIESYCFLLAYWHFNEAGQDPGAPGAATGLANRIYHAEFGGDHQQCPGSAMWSLAQATWDRIVEIGRAYIYGAPLSYPLTITYPPNWTGAKVPTPAELWASLQPAPRPKPTPKPTTYATPTLPKWWKDQLNLKFPTDQKFGNSTWYAARRKSVVLRDTAQRATASAKGRLAGDMLHAGDIVHVERLIKASDGQEWVVLHAGGRGVEGARVRHADLKDTPGTPDETP